MTMGYRAAVLHQAPAITDETTSTLPETWSPRSQIWISKAVTATTSPKRGTRLCTKSDSCIDIPSPSRWAGQLRPWHRWRCLIPWPWKCFSTTTTSSMVAKKPALKHQEIHTPLAAPKARIQLLSSPRGPWRRKTTWPKKWWELNDQNRMPKGCIDWAGW